jgi:hypothetical protein
VRRPEPKPKDRLKAVQYFLGRDEVRDEFEKEAIEYYMEHIWPIAPKKEKIEEYNQFAVMTAYIKGMLRMLPNLQGRPRTVVMEGVMEGLRRAEAFVKAVE